MTVFSISDMSIQKYVLTTQLTCRFSCHVDWIVFTNLIILLQVTQQFCRKFAFRLELLRWSTWSTGWCTFANCRQTCTLTLSTQEVMRHDKFDTLGRLRTSHCDLQVWRGFVRENWGRENWFSVYKQTKV